MKPDWKDAPEWAQWLAQDEDGYWTWFEVKPCKGLEQWVCPGTQYEIVRPRNDPNPNWRDTLEQRPEIVSLMNGNKPSGVVIEKRPPEELCATFSRVLEGPRTQLPRSTCYDGPILTESNEQEGQPWYHPGFVGGMGKP